MSEITISLGTDCVVAFLLRGLNIRTQAFMLDWCASYSGAYTMISERFRRFFEWYYNPLLPNDVENIYHVLFSHDPSIKTDPSVKDKYLRRIERFHNVLNSSTKVHLIRVSHKPWSHEESTHQVNETEDIQKLDQYLSTEYPKLDYKITLINCCKHCSDAKNITSDRLRIINVCDRISRTTRHDRQYFDNIINEVLTPLIHTGDVRSDANNNTFSLADRYNAE